MTVWRRILQGLAAFSGTTLVTNVSGVLQAMLTLRYLTVAEFGALTFLISVHNVASIFIDLGIGAMVSTEVAKARGVNDAPRIKALISVYGRLVALTGVVLCIIFGGVAWQRQDALWLVISAYLLLAALNHAPEILFLSHTRYRRTAALTLTRSLARLALLASLPLWSGSARLIGVALTYPLMETLTLLVSLWMARPIWRELQTAATGRADLRALMRRQGVWVMLAIPVKRVSDELPTWLLKSLAGDVAVGLYGAAHKAMNMAYSIFAPLETILFPLVSELVVQDSERIRLMLRQTQKYTVWLSLAMILACVPLAPWLVLFIGGSQYAPTVPVLQWSLLYLMPLAFMQSQRPMFYALSEQRWMLFTHLLGVALYAPLLWIGIRSTGPIGAAQAMVFYGILLAAIRLVVLRRLAPELWVSPLEVFGIDQFDRELFRRARLRLRRLISAHGRSDIA